MTETTKTKRLERQDREDEERETPITLGEDMIDFMGDQTPLSQHLREIRKIILDGGFLVRRMSEAESMPYEMSDFALDPENVFMKGKENMKAFRVDEEYSFKDKTRDKDADKYAIIVKVFLTPKLKQYFINYLFANVKNLLGVTFSFNPQFKYEQGGVTILIPKSGWGEFWSFVAGDYSIESAGGEKGGDGPSFEEVSDEKEKDQKKSEETQELDIDEEIADVETFDPSSLLSGESLETVWTEDALGKTFEGADGKSYQLIERTMGGKFLFKRL